MAGAENLDEFPEMRDTRNSSELGLQKTHSVSGAQEQLRPVANDPTRASLQPADLRGVLTAVADAVRLLRLGDPDRPIKPSEWYRLVERPDDSVAEMVTAAAGASTRVRYGTSAGALDKEATGAHAERYEASCSGARSTRSSSTSARRWIPTWARSAP